jgi:hypothetical protein
MCITFKSLFFFFLSCLATGLGRYGLAYSLAACDVKETLVLRCPWKKESNQFHVMAITLARTVGHVNHQNTNLIYKTNIVTLEQVLVWPYYYMYTMVSF